MLEEFIDFANSVFPSIPIDTKENAKKAIAQFAKEGEQIKYLTFPPLSKFSQGDIISEIPFYYFDENGKQKMFKAKALVLSTSCHIDNKDKLCVVPVLPLNMFDGNIFDLKKNTVFDYMYIPDKELKNLFIDFEVINTFSKDIIMHGMDNGHIKKIASLNQVGYYFFIIKLTIYLMRREDAGTLEERNLEFAY